jgi:hypothetical protein
MISVQKNLRLIATSKVLKLNPYHEQVKFLKLTH